MCKVLHILRPNRWTPIHTM